MGWHSSETPSSSLAAAMLRTSVTQAIAMVGAVVAVTSKPEAINSDPVSRAENRAEA